MSDLDPRRALALANIQPAGMRGLEIGPLNNPLVRKGEGEILYVDFADTDTLKAKPYDASIDPADIVETDVVWGQGPLKDAVGAPVDYIVAAHVIEHTPDMIGWLNDLAGALAPGGLLSLVIPDKRYTFDLQRPPTTLGDLLEAYLLGRRQPSIRHVVDNCFSAVSVDARAAWASDLASASLPKLTGDLALPLAFDQAVGLIGEPRYIDSHCWVFTPQHFLTILDVLARLRLLPFTVESFTPTAHGEFEFFVQLRHADPQSVDEIRASIARFLSPEPTSQERLDAIQRSASWRVTAPLRRLQRWLGRR